jgi:hypothetical protein
VRKQYSFLRATGDRDDEAADGAPGAYDAWDVDRLIERAADLPVRAVALSSISELDEVYWFGADGDPATVRQVIEHARLIRDADLTYPIILGADGRVMDGMHRVARAVLDGRDAIDAVRFETDPPPDHRGVHPDDLSYEEEGS